jgi:hypothetical protein
MTINENLLNRLMKEACKSGVDENGLYIKLLHIVMDLERRIKTLEEIDPILPFVNIPGCGFVGIPNIPAIPFMAIEEIGFPPVEVSKELNEHERLIYNHLVSKGCNWEDAVVIAREIEGFNSGK